ncbi:hypothetical protein ACJX0J_022511, partial [Zea mays]
YWLNPYEGIDSTIIILFSLGLHNLLPETKYPAPALLGLNGGSILYETSLLYIVVACMQILETAAESDFNWAGMHILVEQNFDPLSSTCIGTMVIWSVVYLLEMVLLAVHTKYMYNTHFPVAIGFMLFPFVCYVKKNMWHGMNLVFL